MHDRVVGHVVAGRVHEKGSDLLRRRVAFGGLQAVEFEHVSPLGPIDDLKPDGVAIRLKIANLPDAGRRGRAVEANAVREPRRCGHLIPGVDVESGPVRVHPCDIEMTQPAVVEDAANLGNVPIGRLGHVGRIGILPERRPELRLSRRDGGRQ